MDQQVIRPSVEQQKFDVLRKLIDVMTDTDSSSADRKAAKRSLQRIGNHTIVGTLGQMIEQNDNGEILSDIVDVLSVLPANASVRGSLIQLLWDDSPIVRQSVIESICRRGDTMSASVLTVLISDSQQSDTIFGDSDGELAQQARDAILQRNC